MGFILFIITVVVIFITIIVVVIFYYCYWYYYLYVSLFSVYGCPHANKSSRRMRNDSGG
jgi:hypothetical protein